MKDKQTFPNLDFVGWFTTSPLSPTTLQIHNLFTSLNPLPILVILDPSGLSASYTDALPINVYESILSAGNVDVGEVEFRLDTGEAERIGVEHVSKAQTKTDAERSDADECTSNPSSSIQINGSGECFANTSKRHTDVTKSDRDNKAVSCGRC
jgi:hypothetical protein